MRITNEEFSELDQRFDISRKSDTELYALYQDAGDQLNSKKYKEDQTRESLLKLRKAILRWAPDIRFDEKTGKLRDFQTRPFRILIDDGTRIIAFPDTSTSPTIFPYPDIKTRARTAQEVVALLRSQSKLHPDTQYIKASEVSSVSDYFGQTRK